MRPKALWILSSIVAVIAMVHVGTVRATPQSGFSASTIALGRFGPIDVFNQTFFPEGSPLAAHPGKNVWLSMQSTNGPSDLYVQNNVVAPGGVSGWHTHSGHSLIIVTAGTITAYEGDDPSCTPHRYSAGQGFVDPGGDHVHMLRNEASVEARTVAVQLIPAGATRRIDAPASPYCRF
jgi:quercetin dioxygenase-like cupin family protein